MFNTNLFKKTISVAMWNICGVWNQPLLNKEIKSYYKLFKFGASNSFFAKRAAARPPHRSVQASVLWNAERIRGLNYSQTLYAIPSNATDASVHKITWFHLWVICIVYGPHKAFKTNTKTNVLYCKNISFL